MVGSPIHVGEAEGLTQGGGGEDLRRQQSESGSGRVEGAPGAKEPGVNGCGEVELRPTPGPDSRGTDEWTTWEKNLGVRDPVAADQRDGSCKRAANCFRTAELKDQITEPGFPAPAGKGNSVQFTSGENGHLRGKYVQIGTNSISPFMPAPS